MPPSSSRLPRPPETVEHCPVDTALAVIRGRWKGTILWLLSERPMRTSELRRRIPRISERMLIRHLQELVGDGVLDRHDAGTVPPHVTYSVSEYGRTLEPVVRALCSWGGDHLDRHTPAR
ncbi:helix-turn-helix transcriptional regulator [Nocardioides sp. cx-169]|uniref:winged helix-turn-helix transcriptional regulator n=1 Tax=Nocardioides sp. cx-169 TaxID=2899080 RepID=UPI001E3F6A2B|nr:helix-turn-helix domain-containing protein [Nocardioides sp. cx-169]MCD4533164.1 helix-turn-helix transcriptional regulator [Nocardioides sp. cx-169]